MIVLHAAAVFYLVYQNRCSKPPPEGSCDLLLSQVSMSVYLLLDRNQMFLLFFFYNHSKKKKKKDNSCNSQRNLIPVVLRSPFCLPAFLPLSTVIAVSATQPSHPIRLSLAVYPPLNLSLAHEAKSCFLSFRWLIEIMWTDTGGAQSSRSPRLDEEWGAAVQIRDPLCYCVLSAVALSPCCQWYI